VPAYGKDHSGSVFTADREFFPTLQGWNFGKGHVTLLVAARTLHIAILRRRTPRPVAIGGNKRVHRHAGAANLALVSEMNCSGHGCTAKWA
jgi:hypothetical protein